MSGKSSTFAIVAISVILGLVLGGFGISRVSQKLSPDARTVANNQDNPIIKPQFYGSK